jgi:hypothetical protein
MSCIHCNTSIINKTFIRNHLVVHKTFEHFWWVRMLNICITFENFAINNNNKKSIHKLDEINIYSKEYCSILSFI